MLLLVAADSGEPFKRGLLSDLGYGTLAEVPLYQILGELHGQGGVAFHHQLDEQGVHPVPRTPHAVSVDTVTVHGGRCPQRRQQHPAQVGGHLFFELHHVLGRLIYEACGE